MSVTKMYLEEEIVLKIVSNYY